MSNHVQRASVFGAALMTAAAILSLSSRQCCGQGQGQGRAPINSSAAAVAAPAQPSAPADVPAGVRVFYASHSLMWDMPPVLAQQVQAYGIKDHTVVGVQRIGVSRTMQHWNLPDERNRAKQALRTGKVDVFVTSNLVRPDEGIDNFVKLGLEFSPNMRFLMQISWPGLRGCRAPLLVENRIANIK